MMKILVAQDSIFYRHLLVSTLREGGYDPLAVADGTSAWEILQRDDAPQVAIIDWMMPGMDGPDVCKRLREFLKPEPTYLLILTFKSVKKHFVTALESGADDYVIKPFDREELRARLRVGLRIVGLQTSQSVVFAFARAVEAKSPYTQGHAERVTYYAMSLAGAIGVSSTEMEILRQGGLLHDVGKICIPDEILDKPGASTDAEFDVIRQHPARGVAIVEPLHSMKDVIPLIRWHHERTDGKGYSDGLPAEEIPHLVRVLSVADVYDALSSKRPYRDAIPHETCLDILRSNAAKGGLDPPLVEVFCQTLTSLPDPSDASRGVYARSRHTDWNHAEHKVIV